MEAPLDKLLQNKGNALYLYLICEAVVAAKRAEATQLCTMELPFG